MPMRLRLIATALMLIPLAGCSNWKESNANPGNWFKGAQADAVVPVATQLPTDPRPMIDTLLSVQLERFPGGVIVRAVGLPPTQGYFDAEMVALPVDENGVLVLEFHLQTPAPGAPVINQQSREITVAYTITNFQLANISRIDVRGARQVISKTP